MGTVVHNTFHMLLAIGLPPLLLGVITRTKALFAGRAGPPVLQPYYDLIGFFERARSSAPRRPGCSGRGRWSGW